MAQDARNRITPSRRRRRIIRAAASSGSTSTPARSSVSTTRTEKRTAGPNDIVFDRAGGFWFTDLGRGARATWIAAGSITPRPTVRSIREAVYPMMTPNGIGLSPDEKTLYAAETQTGRVWKWELDGPGAIAPGRAGPSAGRRIAGGRAGFQLFDSLAVDGAGNVCVATLMNGGITVMSPDGKSVEHVPMPDYMTTNICFGGPDLRTAFITLSSTASWSLRMAAAGSEAEFRLRRAATQANGRLQ